MNVLYHSFPVSSKGGIAQSYLNISQMHNKNTMQSAPVNPWHQPNTAQCRNDNFVSDAKTERDFRDFTDKICEISILEPSFNRRSVLKNFLLNGILKDLFVLMRVPSKQIRI